MEAINGDYLVPMKFYGTKLCGSFKDLDKNKCDGSLKPSNDFIPFDLKRLLGPISTWKVFKRQFDALTFVKSRKNGLMTFVFQQSDGKRLFLAAHPRWLWYYDSIKDPKHRCSYEIIPEYTVCKLYFDLEFEIPLNKSHDGVVMVDTFIKIILHYLKKIWSLKTDRKFIIDLDSSTDIKFSRHLVFNLPNAAFRDNYNVGKFVKFICQEIKFCIEQLEKDCNYSHDFMRNCHLDGFKIKSLKIFDAKGKSSLFCDEGVYTKNRHFRLFKSTKPGKNAPLVISTENLYQPKPSLLNPEEQLFLDSLITHVPNENIKILQFNYQEEINKSSVEDKAPVVKLNSSLGENTCTSPYPKIDQFIENLVHPGHIWRSNYFQTSNKIVYDIIGNRYCGNIGRQHRSNNIKQIVDVSKGCVYQKCHDPDCATYRSQSTLLPPEILFYLEDEFDNYILEQDTSFDSQLNLTFDDSIDDKEFVEVADVVEQISCSVSLEDNVDFDENH